MIRTIPVKQLCLFLVLLASCCNNSYAQHAYIPIPGDSALWITIREDWHEGEPPPATHTFNYSIGWTDGRDTIVNGRKYQCYFGEWLNTAVATLPIGQYPAYFGYWIRQDTIAKKIWYIRDKSQPGNEELLYDFSLHAGDTITSPQSSYFNSTRLGGAKAWVDHIDSVYWADGKWHYRWWITSNYSAGLWAPVAQAVQIEGMGYTNNFWDDPFLRFHPLVGYTLQLGCFRTKGLWMYEQPNPWNADCDSMIKRNVAVGINEVRAVNELELPILYPNPVSTGGMLFINAKAGNPDQQYHLYGYDILGRQVTNILVRPGGVISLHEYHLPPGIYSFRFTTLDNLLLHTQKIIFQ